MDEKVTKLSQQIEEISETLKNKPFVVKTEAGITIDRKSIASIKTCDWLAKAFFSFALAFAVTLTGLYFGNIIGLSGLIFALIPTIGLLISSLITVVMLKDLVHA